MNIEPGDFEISDDPYTSDEMKATEDQTISASVELEESDSTLARGIALFTKNFNVPKRIIYPACGHHVIDNLFPDSEIVYVDPSVEDINLIRQHISSETRALALRIEEVQEHESFGGLVSLNSHASMEEQLRRVKQGGLIFCNEYFGTRDAEAIINLGTCTLLAVINYDSDEDDNLVLQTEGLENYLQAVEPPPSKITASKRIKSAVYYIFQKD